MRAEAVLVIHRNAVLNIVTHVQPAAALRLADIEFSQYGHRTERLISEFRCMKKIDAGHNARSHVHQTDGDQLIVASVQEFARKFEVAIQKRLPVLVAFNLTKRPAATVVHVSVIVVIQIQVLGRDRRRLNDQLEIGIAIPSTSLTFCGLKGGDVNSQTAAFVTAAADWTKQIAPETPPTSFQQMFVALCRQSRCNSVLHP